MLDLAPIVAAASFAFGLGMLFAIAHASPSLAKLRSRVYHLEQIAGAVMSDAAEANNRADIAAAGLKAAMDRAEAAEIALNRYRAEWRPLQDQRDKAVDWLVIVSGERDDATQDSETYLALAESYAGDADGLRAVLSAVASMSATIANAADAAVAC